MKKILFVTYGGGHMKIIEPIATKLLEEKGIKFKILALTSAYSFMLDKYSCGVVKKVSDYSFLFDDIINQVMSYGLEFLDDNYSSKSIASKEETIYYIGLSFYDLIQRVGKKEAYRLYKEKKRQAFLPVTIIEKILKYEQIDLVISTTSPRFEQASFIAANALNIETLEILDLFANIFPLPEANNIVVMNQNVKEKLISRKLKNKQYYALGQPAIENTKQLVKAMNSKLLKKKMNLNNNKTIVFMTQKMVQFNDDLSIGDDIEYKYILGNIFSIMKKINKMHSVNILLRIHPSEDIEEYGEYLNTHSYVKYLNNDLNLNESLAISDIVVLHSSTVGVEAIVSNKQVFTYKHERDIKYPCDEMRSPPFIFSDGFEELEKNLCQYLDSPTPLINTEDLLPKNSVENIIKLIKEL